MGRPMVCTAKLSTAEVATVKRYLVSITHAYRELMPSGTPLSYAVFYRVATGRPATPSAVDTFRDAWRAWKAKHLKGAAV